MSHRNNSKVGQLVRNDVYDDGQNALIAKLIDECPPLCVTLAAVPDEVIGWACRSPTVVHYVYTKFAFRRIGAATLLAAGARYYTHQTKIGDLLFKRLGSLYNPYLLYNGVPACRSN